MKRLLKYILVTIIVIATSIAMSMILTSQLETPTEVASHDLEAATDDPELIDPSETTDGTTSDAVEDHSIDDAGTIYVVQEPLMGQGVWRPISDKGKDQEIYCVEPGVLLKISGLNREQVEAYDGQVCERGCGQCASWGDAKFSSGKYAGQPKFSNPYYYCQGNHVTETSTSIHGKNVGNTYDVAYIVSFYPAKVAGEGMVMMDPDAWSGGKQYAIWKSNLSRLELQDRTVYQQYVSEGEAILKQAEVYQKMKEDIDATSYTEPSYGTTHEKEAGKMTVAWNEEELKEMQDNIKVDSDYEKQLHKIGPFKLNYVYGWKSELGNTKTESGAYPISQYSMSGISDMYLLTEDGERIDIVAFIRPNADELLPFQGDPPREGKTTGSRYDAPKFWSYISPTGVKNPNMVDFFCYNQWRNYPAPNEEFYVEIDYEGELPAALKLHVEYSYLNIHFLACIRDGVSYVVDDNPHDHLYNPHEHCCGRDEDGCYCWYDHWGCYFTLYITTEHRQALTYVDYYREIIKEEYEIPFYTTTTMKVGGFVYEDSPQTKDEVANGIKDDNEHVMPNIQVTLYEADENGNLKLAELKTLEEEFPEMTEQEIIDKAFNGDRTAYENDYKRRINPTLTDEYGYYEFRGVTLNRKYVVQFTYNGQTYMPTEYLTKTGDGGYSYGSVEEMVEAGAYASPSNSEDMWQRWRETSKGLEKKSERDVLTERFKEIGSYPKNYPSTNSLGEVGDYNETFSTYELLGFELQKDGTYKQTGTRLIDSYLTIDDEGKIVDRSITVNDDGVVTVNTDEKIEEGLISQKIKEYIEANHKYPEDLKNDIYQDVVSAMGIDSDLAWRMLQFIEDCKINSYTLNNVEDDSSYDLYPVYDEFTTYVADGNKYPENSYSNGTFDEDASTYEDHTQVTGGTGEYEYIKYELVNGATTKVTTTESDPDALKIPGNQYKNITYKNIYPGQLYINQGLWRRQEVDLALEKDIYKATVKINGKTEVYDYDSYGHGVITPSEISRLKEEYTHNGVFDEAGFKEALNNLFTDTARERWDIHLRMADYANYYEPLHHRAIYRADYEYVTQPNRTGAPLDVYITYKISVKNQSQTILGQVLEVVDYYDEDFEYMEDLSWVTYEDGIVGGEKEAAEDVGDDKGANYISSEEYYNMMDNIENGATSAEITNAKDIKSSDTTRYDSDTESDITERTITDGNTGLRANYDAVYVRGLEDKKLAAGETAYIYLTFKIKTDGSGKVIINESEDEYGEDKMNFAEINGYSTYYKEGTTLPNYGDVGPDDYASLIDIDSKPGNLEADDLEEEKYESNFEDDTDRAKALHIYVDDEAVREINGVVWEDERNKIVDGATIGDGIKQNEENTVNDVWVELWEIEVDNNGNPIIVEDEEGNKSYKLKDGVVQIYEGGGWTSANENTAGKGQYEFTGFIPGDYIVRFNYGNEHNATYNGQDFKSTSYQVGIDQNGKTDAYTDTNKEGRYDGYTDVENQNETGLYGYDIAKADQDSNNYSDAKDIWSRREQINNYSNNNGNGVTNELAYTLSQHTTPNPNTEMKAETGAIVAEVEYNRQNSNSSSDVEGEADSGSEDYNSNSDELYLNGNDINAKYSINNVDFGLVERPKAQLELNKKVTNVRLTLANGQIIVDSTTQGPYLSWVSGKAYNILQKRTEQDDTIYETDYNEDNGGERYKDHDGENHGTEYYEYRKELITDKFTSHASGNGYNGLIQINMDEELMHGATIRIEYTLTVTNAGEVDYDGKDFYYRGNKSGNIVTTSADQVIDYVNNNLQFRADENKAEDGSQVWSIISTDEVINGQNGEGSKLVNDNVAGIIKTTVDGREVNLYNSIVQTETLKKDLKPKTESVEDGETTISTKLVLSQLITAQNDTDDLTYDNIAEIVKTTNSVGRRMAYSVAGNQDPTQIPSEVDTAKAERVMILPPFGSATYVYIIIALTAATILVVGIILIKKKVIGKKE